MRLIAVLCLLASLAPAQEVLSSRDKIKIARDAAKGGPESIPQLDPLLLDTDVEVRREAIKALSQIGTQHGLDLLTRSTADGDAEIQIRAIDSLVNFYSPGYIESSLTKTLKRAGSVLRVSFKDEENTAVVDPDMAVRPEIMAAIRKVLASCPDNVVRANAARALGVLRDKEAVGALSEALRSKDDRLIFESLIAMQKIGDIQSGERAVFLLRDLVEKIQLASIETVGLLRTKEAVGELRRVLDTASEKKVRRAAVLALARIGDASSRDNFRGLLNDRDEEIRAAAAEGLGRIGNEDDLPLVRSAFTNEGKTYARLGQCYAIARLGGLETTEFSALRYLVNNLNSKSWRGIAQPYLTELMRQKRVREAVYPLLASGSTDERTGLLMALAGSGAEDAIAHLEALVRDADLEVANTATRALRILRAAVLQVY